MSIPVLVLAAGHASRYGGDKLCAEIDGKSVLSWSIGFAVDGASAEQVRVVLGPDQRDRLNMCDESGVEHLVAPEAARGMRWSLQAGLDSCDRAVLGAIVTLADDPLALRALPDVIRVAECDPSVVVAVRRSPFLPHPVYLPRDRWPAPPTGDDDRGLRSLLDADTTWLDHDSERPVDVDVPSDLADLARALQRRGDA